MNWAASEGLSESLWRCRRLDIAPATDLLIVCVHRQRMSWFQLAVRDTIATRSLYFFRREFLISTSRFGIGQIADSHKTPLGLHRIARKIGAGWPTGTAFKNRLPIGYIWQGIPDAAIAHRILWLEGLEPGLNRGGNLDTFARYIYIHGLGDEPTLGRPASRGCIHLAGSDLIPLFDQLTEATLVYIAE